MNSTIFCVKLGKYIPEMHHDLQKVYKEECLLELLSISEQVVSVRKDLIVLKFNNLSTILGHVKQSPRE